MVLTQPSRNDYRLLLLFLLLRPSILNPNAFSFDDSPLFQFAMSNLKHPHQKYIANLCVLEHNLFATKVPGSSIYFWWRWADLHRRPRQHSNNFNEFCYCIPKNQITKRMVRPPAKIFRAPNCLAFCSGVQSFFQYLFIVPSYHLL